MEQTQKISAERLAEIVGAGKLWCGDPGMQTMARELTALRASHKRVVEVVRRVASINDGLPHNKWVRGLGIQARAALAEDGKLEGK